jgi:hypothetical protein
MNGCFAAGLVACVALICATLAAVELPTASGATTPPSCGSAASRSFRRYDLGTTYRHLIAVRTIRRCDAPYPGEQIRANFVEHQYARCKRCTVAISVQNWPACERGRADVTAPLPGGIPSPRMHELELRQVPALYFPDDRRLELYTGKTTIVLFGADLASLRHAALRLRTEHGQHPRVVPAAALPTPAAGALDGTLPCTRTS